MKKLIFIFLWAIAILACEEIINEENISKDTVSVIAPTHNSTLETKKEINYNWQSIDGARNYELQIATPNFDDAAQIHVDTIVTNVLFSVDSLEAGDYEWRVRALNGAFSTAYSTNGFIVEKP